MEAVNIQNLGGQIVNLGQQGKNFINGQSEGEGNDFSTIFKSQLDLAHISLGDEELIDKLLNFLSLDEESVEEELSLEDLSLFMENILRIRENQLTHLNLNGEEKLEDLGELLKKEEISLINDAIVPEKVQSGDEKNISLSMLENSSFKENLNLGLKDKNVEADLNLKGEEIAEGKDKLLRLDEDFNLKVGKNKDIEEGKNFLNQLNGPAENPKTNMDSVNNPSNLKFMEDNMESLRENLIGSIDTLKDGEATTIKVKLTPRELGEVDIDIKLENGKLVGRIIVESQRVQDLFIKNMAELTENLNKNGTNFEEIEIDLKQNLSDFNDGNQGFQGQEGARQNSQRNFINRLVKNKAISEIPNVSLDRKTKNPYELQANNLNILV